MNIISNDGSNKLNRSRKASVSYKVQRTINASLNAATSTRAVSIFFFNDTATTEIYTLSLHDALPISSVLAVHGDHHLAARDAGRGRLRQDRKSTRLNSSHLVISYAVFCLKKKITSAINSTGAGKRKNPTIASVQ